MEEIVNIISNNENTITNKVAIDSTENIEEDDDTDEDESENERVINNTSRTEDSSINKGASTSKAAQEESKKKQVCLFCKRKSENSFTEINEKEDILEGLRALTIEYEPIQNLSDYICYQCVYRINVIIDFRRLLDRNIRKSRANYYYNIGNKLMCRKFLFTEKESRLIITSSKSEMNTPCTISSTSKNFPRMRISDVRTIAPNRNRDDENGDDYIFECINSIQIGTSPELVTLYEKPESVLVTESGGEVAKTNENNINERFICECNKVFKTQRMLKKHERTHIMKKRSRTPVNHHCNSCFGVFETVALLRAHVRTHKKELLCRHCNKVYLDPSDWELHEAECFGRKCAERQTQGYQTRSRTASIKSTQRKQQKSLVNCRRNTTNESDSDETDSDEEMSDGDTIISERVRNINKWVDNSTPERKNYPDDDQTKSVCSDVRSEVSEVSSFTRASSVTDVESDDVEYLSDSTESSSIPEKSFKRAADSVYNLKIAKRRKNNNSMYTALGYPCEHGYPQDISTYPMRDDENEHMYKCLETDCTFTSRDINLLHKHDVDRHKNLPLFYCKRCKRSFIRKCYLDYHLRYEHNAWLFCIKCEHKFDYQYQLTEHLLIEHPHKCEECNLSFTTRNLLEGHWASKKHEKRINTKPIFMERYDYGNAKYDEDDEDDDDNRKDELPAYSSKALQTNALDVPAGRLSEVVEKRIEKIRKLRENKQKDSIENYVSSCVKPVQTTINTEYGMW